MKIIGFLVLIVSVTYLAFEISQSLLFTFLTPVFVVLIYVVLVNLYATKLIGRPLKIICDTYGIESSPPHTKNVAEGKIYFDGKFDIGGISITDEGIHIYRFGLVSHLLSWESIRAVRIEECENKPCLRLFLSNGVTSFSDFLIPWESDLESHLSTTVKIIE